MLNILHMVTDKQVRKYRQKRAQGLSQEKAALAAAMDVKTARKWEEGQLPSTRSKKPRDWRTREDPLRGIFEREVIPMLEKDEHGLLQATTVLEELREKPSCTLTDGVLRTLQRRISDWRAHNGPGKEVFFPQMHEPGHEAQFDFTRCGELGITVAGDPFDHMIFELILTFSSRRALSLTYGETTEALIDGFQQGFRELGGVTKRVCHDSLSAATCELKRSGGRDFTPRFKGLLAHYGLEGRRVNVGQANENGVVEKGHDVLKTALEQALILRGSKDFDAIDCYWQFVLSIKDRLNRKCEARYQQEKPFLRGLPSTLVPSYTDFSLKVGKFSCIQVSNNTYSVPARLIGHRVKVRRYANEIQVLYNERVVETLPRLRGRNQHRINYRHIIDSLVRKPGAFARYRFREDLFPSLTFRKAYDALIQFRGERADVEYVRILDLAAKTMESDVEAALLLLLESRTAFEYGDLQGLVDPKPRPEQLLESKPLEPDLIPFDELLTEEMHACLTR